MKILYVCADRYPNDGACTNLLKKLFFEGGLIKKYEIELATYKYKICDKDAETIDRVKINRLFSLYNISMKNLAKHILNFKIFFWGILLKVKSRLLLHCPYNIDIEKMREIKLYLLHLCETEKYDIIVGVAGCYEMAIAAKNVAVEKSIPFVLYQVDPFSTNIMYSQDNQEKRLAIEMELYRSAAKVFTTKIILDEMLKRFSMESLDNVEVMEFPGVSIREEQTEIVKRVNSKITCVFAGRVYAGVRNPTFAIEIFRHLPNNIEFKLVGVTESELKKLFAIESLPENVKCCGLLSVEEADKAIMSADVLINIGNIMKNQVPSKLFSYISTGKPIINICENPDCPSKGYLEKYPLALSIDIDDVELDNNIVEVENFIRANCSKTCNLLEISKIYRTCTPKYCAMQMDKAFNKICGMKKETKK